METRSSLRSSSVICVVFLLSIASAYAEDQAVIVGINTYDVSFARLKGCVPDARDMADTLPRYGFTVKMLLDTQATKQGILDALRVAAARSKRGDRFVFYFAGHGTNWDDATTVILPYDFKLFHPEEKDLTQQELTRAILAIPASSRTVILDSCHSEGMMRGSKALQRHASMQVRYFSRSLDAGAKDLIAVNRTEQVPTAPGICYLVACKLTEGAVEADINGQRRGIFTYALGNLLKGNAENWGNVQTNIAKSVQELTEDLQHPTLSPAYRSRPVFEKGGPLPLPTPTPSQKTLWDIYSEDNVDPASLELTMAPNYKGATVPLGKQFSFNAKVGTRGYLVIMERGTSNDVNILFPASRDLKRAAVEAGATIMLPGDTSKAFTAGDEGTERIKAILFSNPDDVAALLSKFPESGPIKNWGNLRDLVIETRKDDRAKFWTSTLSFQAVRK